MASLRPELGSRLPAPVDRWRRTPARRPASLEANRNLLIAGAVVVGLGYLTWVYLGPDLKRYLKIHAM